MTVVNERVTQTHWLNIKWWGTGNGSRVELPVTFSLWLPGFKKATRQCPGGHKLHHTRNTVVKPRPLALAVQNTSAGRWAMIKQGNFTITHSLFLWTLLIDSITSQNHRSQQALLLFPFRSHRQFALYKHLMYLLTKLVHFLIGSLSWVLMYTIQTMHNNHKHGSGLLTGMQHLVQSSHHEKCLNGLFWRFVKQCSQKFQIELLVPYWRMKRFSWANLLYQPFIVKVFHQGPTFNTNAMWVIWYNNSLKTGGRMYLIDSLMTIAHAS